MPIASEDRGKRWERAWALGLTFRARASPAFAQSVLTYHGRADRSGTYTMPALSWEQARSLRLDAEFTGRFEGHLYAQPLYWRPQGAAAGLLPASTEPGPATA